MIPLEFFHDDIKFGVKTRMAMFYVKSDDDDDDYDAGDDRDYYYHY